MRQYRNFSTVSIILVLVFTGSNLQAQILNKIKNRVKEKTEDRIVNKAEKASDKGLDGIENSAQNKGNSNDKKENGNKSNDKHNDNNNPQTLQDFKNYDFVPGDKLIFFYDMAGEADSEIPGRMLINAGNAEIQTYQGEKVLVAPRKGELNMAPLMKSNSYLPEQFTLEFDLMMNGGIGTTIGASEIRIYFKTKDEAGNGSATAPILVRIEAVSGDNPAYGLEVYKGDNTYGAHSRSFPPAAVNKKQDNWRHVAIYVNKNIGKLYIDQHRLAVLNQVVPGQVNLVEIGVEHNDEHPVLLKNFRIASGGDDAYKKVVTEGKFIAYGIQFDVNKSTIKPESMGTINEFVKMMKENPNLKFEIGGHTDSDGTAQRNDQLSKERAEAVKSQMIKLGIDANRLFTNGYGSAKPIVQNDNAENKARNRRVEFVKQ